MSKEITEIQKRILDFIRKQKDIKGFPPTLSEIAEYFGYRNRSTVQQHLKALEKKGMIKRTPGLSRAINIKKEEKLFSKHAVIGEVAAGNPLTIYQDAIDTVELPSIIKMPVESFLLRVKGNSLKDAFIFNGDIVIVNPNIEPRNGQIVTAVLEDAAVVKRFYKKQDKIELVSENPEFKPIIIEKTYSKFKVVGVVIGVYRSMETKAG